MLTACAFLAMMMTADATVLESLSVGQLKNGQRFEIRTEDGAYEAELVNRKTGECRMRVSDGSRYSEPRTVFIVGATRGVQDRLTLLRMHEVCVGMKVELGLDDLSEANRAHTANVTGFALLPAKE